MRTRFGDRHDCAGCGRSAHYYRVSTRRSYVCEYCGHQVYPTAGTPFERTRTPLRDWFYVIYLLCASRNGVAAKEVERQLGVTYKTAWRMCHMIREYMGSVADSGPIGGEGKTVEIDEALIGGSVSGMGSGHKANKTAVVGMLQHGGDIVARVTDKRTKQAMHSLIADHVRPGTELHTDEFGGYKDIDQKGYQHLRVNHSVRYVSDEGASINGVEGFWGMLKRGINGTHIHVSGKHLPKYLGEFSYRWNMRRQQHLMVGRLMASFVR